MARRRAQRAGRLIQEEISKIIQRELKDPRIGFVTITEVNVTDDLHYAKVFITVLKRENKKKTLKGLEHAKGFIRREIGQRIKMRFTPEIEFKFDEAAERGVRIEEVLRKIATAKTPVWSCPSDSPEETDGRTARQNLTEKTQKKKDTSKEKNDG